MKIWTWIKSLSWVAIAGAIVTAVLMVLGAAKAGRHERRAKRAEAIAESIVQDHTKKSIEKAAGLQKKAAAEKQKAAVVREKAEKRLEEIGAKDETLADIAERFNGRRVRQRTDGSA